MSEPGPPVILITGSSRGIGAETAVMAAERGYHVALTYESSAESAKEVSRKIEKAGGRGAVFRADVGSATQVCDLFNSAEGELGPITALVNNAGITGPVADVSQMEVDDIERVVRTNTLGTILCCREAVNRMSVKAGGRGGAIVNVSSFSTTIGGRPGSSIYAATKAAIDNLTLGLAREVAQDGIRVNAVRPAFTRTDMTADVHRDAQKLESFLTTLSSNRPADPAEIARPILWLLSPEASYVSGSILDISGGGYKISGHRSRE